MEYPVTIEQLKKAFADTCGEEMPGYQDTFWKSFADVLNGAYEDGERAGMKKVAQVK